MSPCTKHTVTQQVTLVGEVEPVIHLGWTQKLRFSRTHPSLETFDHVRFLPGEHKLIPNKQGKCKYCQYLVAVARVKKEPLPEIILPITKQPQVFKRDIRIYSRLKIIQNERISATFFATVWNAVLLDGPFLVYNNSKHDWSNLQLVDWQTYSN